MTVLPMVLISVGVIMRMCTVLVLPELVLPVVVFAVVRWAMVVGHHGGRPSVVVPTMMIGLTEVGAATRLGGVLMVVSLTLAMEPIIVGNLSVVMKPTMVAGFQRGDETHHGGWAPCVGGTSHGVSCYHGDAHCQSGPHHRIGGR